MDGHMDVQREAIIPRHYCVAGYKKYRGLLPIRPVGAGAISHVGEMLEELQWPDLQER